MNKLRRAINKQNFSKLGITVGVAFLFTNLLYIIFNFVNHSYDNEHIFSAISDAVSLVFYLIIISNFIKCSNDLFYGYYSLLLLILNDFIIPLIQYMVDGIINLTIILPSISSIVAILYFIFLSIENKKRTPNSIKWLKIFGVIFAIFSIINSAYLISLMGMSLQNLIASNAYTTWELLDRIVSIVLYVICLIGEPLIFGVYPFVLYKERYI